MKLLDRFKPGDIIEVISFHPKDGFSATNFMGQLMFVPIEITQIDHAAVTSSNKYVFMRGYLIDSDGNRLNKIVFAGVKIKKYVNTK